MKTEEKSKKPSKLPKKSNQVDPVVIIIGRLQKLYPIAFPKNPTPKVPLKVGIFEDLISRSNEIGISEDDLKKAMQTWCKSQRYWSVVKEGATRIDLDGNPSGVVDAKGASQARFSGRKQQTKIASSETPTI